MIARLQSSLKEKDKGFTLVELLVVIVIVGILAAIAIPLFLNQRERAAEAGVKSDIKNAATLQETYFIDENAYADDIADLEAARYDFQKTGSNLIVVATKADSDGFCITGQTAADEPMFYYDSLEGGLLDGAPSGAGACAAPAATPAT